MSYQNISSNDEVLKNLSDHMSEVHELDLVKYRNLGCTYSYKILPTNFYDYDRNSLPPYDETPIQEFDLTFGKTIINKNIDKEIRDEPPVKQVIDEYLEEWMWRDPEDETYD